MQAFRDELGDPIRIKGSNGVVVPIPIVHEDTEYAYANLWAADKLVPAPRTYSFKSE